MQTRSDSNPIREGFKWIVRSLKNERQFRVGAKNFDANGHSVILVNESLGIWIIHDHREGRLFWFLFENKIVATGAVPAELNRPGGFYLGVHLNKLGDFPNWDSNWTDPKYIEQYFVACYRYLEKFISGRTPRKVFAGHRRVRMEVYFD